MRNTSRNLLTALIALGLTASFSFADFVYRGWGVMVRVGPGGVTVQAPGVNVDVQAPIGKAMPKKVEPMKPAPTVLPPEGVDLQIAPPAEPVPQPGDPAKTPTISQFIAGFKPTAGKHQIEVIHPFTDRAVKVSFALPEGKPSEVRIGGALRKSIEFKYGNRDIEIWFYRNGRVVVKN